MKYVSNTHLALASLLALSSITASRASAATIVQVTTFATGTAVNSTAPDSITIDNNGAIWVSYTNGADSTGASGHSSVIQYDQTGKILKKFYIRGSVDGLKTDPSTGLVWAMQNQDGRSLLTLIDPVLGIVRSNIPYAVKSTTRGYDDVAFVGGQIYESYTNPVLPTDPTIQQVLNVSNPINVSPILLKGATGENLATGQFNQPTSQNDPDSLKVAFNGDLMLTSGDDGQLIFVRGPGTPQQSVSFLNVLDPSGAPVSGLDDALFATSSKGTFYETNTKDNNVLAIQAADLTYGTLFACIGSLSEFAIVDMKTGVATGLVTNLNGPHGLLFVSQHKSDQR